MNIFPAIDLYEGKAVRLLRGDYSQMTVYSDAPVQKAQEFASAGAEYLHLVDLEGAHEGRPVNFETVRHILAESRLRVEVGGGIRSEDAVKRYLDAGAMRVILGTAALQDPELLSRLASLYGERLAVGVDVRDGRVAVKGWLETSGTDCMDFIGSLSEKGVRTVICTDISRDGAMRGANLSLYRELSGRFGLDIVASGGVSSLSDVRALRDMGLYGAILGRALYTGDLSLPEALEAAK